MSQKTKEIIGLIFSALEDMDARLEVLIAASAKKGIVNSSTLDSEAAKVKFTKAHKWKSLRTRLEKAIEQDSQSDIDSQLKDL